MLKIRDGLDLEILLKYGFEKRYDTKTGELEKYIKKRQGIDMTVMLWSRGLTFSFNDMKYNDKAQDLFFDLIKIGILEKRE